MRIKAKEKVGFIFECGRDGPDYKVCHYLLERLSDMIEMVPRFLDRKVRLLSECGEVAALLLSVEKCARVVVTWDLEPPWGGEACRHEDKEKAFKSLTEAKVNRQKVVLLCIEREMECWLMADKRALEAHLRNEKHPHPLKHKLKDYKKPDSEIRRPKTELISLFQRELGHSRKYVDREHALRMIRRIPDWSKLRRSDSFRRFAEKGANITLDEQRP